MPEAVRPLRHLSVKELARCCLGEKDQIQARRWLVIWLLSVPLGRDGHYLSTREVADITGYSRDWVRELVRRYNRSPRLISRYKAPNQRWWRERGRPPLLDEEQEEELRLALASSAKEGKPASVKQVRDWICSETGRFVHNSTAWRYRERLSPREAQPPERVQVVMKNGKKTVAVTGKEFMEVQLPLILQMYEDRMPSRRGRKRKG
jgi:transposase